MSKPGKSSSTSRSSLAGGTRRLKTQVKKTAGRSVSSKAWLDRQLNDPYVAAARERGLRSRAAFKLAQIDEKYQLLRPGMAIVDLGSTPGGWTQIAVDKVKPDKGGRVIAVDINPMDPVAGSVFLQLDFTEEGAEAQVEALLGGGGADGVLSDMASPATGHHRTDHLRIMGLCEIALAFAIDVLKPGGFFLSKVLAGGTEGDLLAQLKRDFAVVRHVKPEASRSDSTELYVLATGYRGLRVTKGHGDR